MQDSPAMDPGLLTALWWTKHLAICMLLRPWTSPLSSLWKFSIHFSRHCRSITVHSFVYQLYGMSSQRMGHTSTPSLVYPSQWGLGLPTRLWHHRCLAKLPWRLVALHFATWLVSLREILKSVHWLMLSSSGVERFSLEHLTSTPVWILPGDLPILSASWLDLGWITHLLKLSNMISLISRELLWERSIHSLEATWTRHEYSSFAAN